MIPTGEPASELPAPCVGEATATSKIPHSCNAWAAKSTNLGEHGERVSDKIIMKYAGKYIIQ